MVRVLFVCKGNTCRSPMAEFVMKELVREKKFDQEIQIASAGCQASEGKDVTNGTKNVLEKHQIPFTEHKSAQFRAEDYGTYDYIIGIDQSNVDGILDIIGDDPKEKVHLLMKFTGKARDVNDPFATKDYEATFVDIHQGCKSLLNHIQKSFRKDTKAMAAVLLEILMNTDEKHPMTAGQIIEAVRAEWKEISGKDETISEATIQRHIKSWNQSGLYSFESFRGGERRGYYRNHFSIEAPEAALIAQALFRAQNLSTTRTEKLLEKLKKFTDATGRDHLDQTIWQLKRTKLRRKTARGQIFLELDELMKAIQKQHKVSFNCYRWDESQKDHRVLVKDEKTNQDKRYIVSPYYIVWEGEDCFLICHWPENDTKEGHILSHFRVSTLTNVQVEDEKNLILAKMVEFPRYAEVSTVRGGEKWRRSVKNRIRKEKNMPCIMHNDEALEEFALDRYLRENVFMYHNDSPPINVKLYFREDSMGEVMSRFAIDQSRIGVRPLNIAFSDDERVFSATVIVQPNEGFYMWLLQHCNEIMVVEPQQVREEMKRRLEVALRGIASYEGDDAIDSKEIQLYEARYKNAEENLRTIQFE